MATINQNPITSPDAIRISYTDKDYLNILDDLINSIPGITEKWETSDVNDPGMVLVKLMAILGDMLFFTQDMQTLEVYPNSVTLRKNAAVIYRLIGYKMRWYKSATLQADVVNTYTNAATIPRFCTFTTTNNEITYTTFNEEYSLESNTLNNGAITTIELIQGNPVTPNRISGNPYPDVGKPWHSIYGYNYTTDDILNNRIYLRNNNIDQDHIIIIDDQGDEWELKDNIYLTMDVGKFFEFGVDSNDNVYVELIDYWGNYNINQFKIFYIISAGEEGQVYANTLTKVTGNVWSRTVIEDVTNVSNVSSFIQFNHFSSTYGYDPETPDEARKNSPYYQNTLDTLITLADFERAVLRIPGIANVRATDLTNDPGMKVNYYLGDINQDGSIDSSDYDLIVEAVESGRALTTMETRLADVNQDGVVDSRDVECIREFLNPTMFNIGDINQDGSITNTDLQALQDYIADPQSSSWTDFQKQLADVNQDGLINEADKVAMQTYLNKAQKEKSPFGQLADETLVAECGKTQIGTTELLEGFVVKLYLVRKDEYDDVDPTYDDNWITMVHDIIDDYKILPLTIDVDLHSVNRYYWTIEGKFYTKKPLSRDELQTIIMNINNTLRKEFAVENMNFNSIVSYRDIIDTILKVDNRILMVDLDPIRYFDREYQYVDKQKVTGEYQTLVPMATITGDVNNDGQINQQDVDLLQAYLEDKKEHPLTEDQLYLADMDHNNIVDEIDLQLLKDKVDAIVNNKPIDNTTYTFTLPNAPILPGSVMVRVNNGQYTLRDNNNGQIFNVNGVLSKKGKIDYVTGECKLEFSTEITDDLIIDYIKNEANIISYSNLSTQTFYFDSTSLEPDDMQDLISTSDSTIKKGV